MPDIWFSASQVSTFQLCNRRWAWNKIAGLRSPGGPALQLGTDTHAELERWLREGRPVNTTIDAGNIAMAGLHLLPMPGMPGLEVEVEFFIEIGGHKFKGYKDFQNLLTDPPFVGDHKTTSDFSWAKTPEDLIEDIQPCLYAADAMYKSSAQACDLNWIYYRTRGARKAAKVHLRVTRGSERVLDHDGNLISGGVAPTLERAMKSCDEMTHYLQNGTQPMDVPPNFNSCSAYGGCEFLELCNPTSAERFEAIMVQQQSAFLHQLAQQQGNGIAINPPQMPHGPAPTPVQDAQGNWVLPQQVPVMMPQTTAPTPVQDAQGNWVLPQQQPQGNGVQINPPMMAPNGQVTMQMMAPNGQVTMPLPGIVAPAVAAKRGRKKAAAAAPVVTNAPPGVAPTDLEGMFRAAVDQATAILAAAVKGVGMGRVKITFDIDGDNVKRSLSTTRGL